MQDPLRIQCNVVATPSSTEIQPQTTTEIILTYLRSIKNELEKNTKTWVIHILLMAAAYGFLVLLLGSNALPGSSLFPFLLCWASAVVLGAIFQLLKMPTILGYLVAGIILRNIPGNILEALKPSWIAALRTITISIVLTRAGVTLNLRAFWEYGWIGLRTGILPVILMGTAVGGIAVPLLKMPWALAFTCAFILASTAPAIVVPETYTLEATRNLGKKKGIATLVAVVATINMVTAIAGYNIFSSLAFNTGSLTWSILSGPVTTLIGIVSGFIGILLWFPIVVPNPKYLVAFLFLLNIGICLLFQHFRWTGAAAIFSITMATVVRFGWDRPTLTSFMEKHLPSIARWPMFDPAPMQDMLELSSRVAAFLWTYPIAPVLFSTIGIVLDFSKGDPSVYGKGVVLIAVSWILCVVSSFVMLFNSDLTFKEKAFVALILPAKATIPAALGGLPLTFFMQYGTQQQQVWGGYIQIVSALAILITTPIAVVLIRGLGPRWLSDEEGEMGFNRSSPSSDEDVENMPAEQVSSQPQRGEELLSRVSGEETT